MIKESQNNTQKKTQFLIFAAYYCSITAAIFFTIKFLIPFFMPFIIGFVVAFILKPITCTISKKTSLSRKICGAVVVILAYCLLTISIWFVCAKIITAIQSFANNNYGIFENEIVPAMKNLNQKINHTINNIFPKSNFIPSEVLENITNSIAESVAEISKSVVVWIAKISATIPNFLIGLTFAITSSIYIGADYVHITQTLIGLMPKNLKKWIIKTKGCTTSTIAKYIQAYLLLMALSFVVLTTGFFIIKIENPVGIAALVAICDAVPIFGSGLIVLPWIVCLAFMQNFNLALKIGVIFLIVSILRGFLEPKILGKQIGLHPVLILIAIYVGIKLFGFLGIVLIPIAAQIGFAIYKSNGKQNSF